MVKNKAVPFLIHRYNKTEGLERVEDYLDFTHLIREIPTPMTSDFAAPFNKSTHFVLGVEYAFINMTFRGVGKTLIEFKPFDIVIEPRAVILKRLRNTVIL